PLTSGAAMLVPLRLMYGVSFAAVPGSRYCDCVTVSDPSREIVETVPTPDASRSGFAARSTRVGPRELKRAIASSLRVSVPCVLDAPTVSTHGAFAGDEIAPQTLLP